MMEMHSSAGKDSTFNRRLSDCYQARAPQLLAALLMKCRDFQRAEDALADAFAQATVIWQNEWPNNEAAWLYRVAHNAMLDGVKHLEVQTRQQARLNEPDEWGLQVDADLLPDDRLALFFLCAHPSLSVDSQALLILRYCALVPTQSIAKWFCLDVETASKRIQRSIHKLTENKIEFELPPASVRQARLPSVLTALEVLYDQSYADIGGGLDADALARDALNLIQALLGMMQNEPEVLGLAALFCFCESRRAARLDAKGAMIPLDQQDPMRWHLRWIEQGADLLLRANRQSAIASSVRDEGPNIGPFQIRAAIHAVHAKRRQTGFTDWVAIVKWYDQLAKVDDSALVLINRGIALLMAGQLTAAVDAFNALDPVRCRLMSSYHLFHAQLLVALRRWGEAISAQRFALGLISGEAERVHIERQIAAWELALATENATNQG